MASIGRLLLSTFLLPSLLQLASAAVDWDKHCEDKEFCLTSFIWCERQNDDGNCEYPSGVYPYRRSANVGRAILEWNRDYNLTWRNTDPDYPVLVEWTVSSEPEDQPGSYTFGKNLTNGETSYSLNFEDMAQAMHDDDSDVDILTVKGAASSLVGNSLRISQPGREYEGVEDDDLVFDYADTFGLADWGIVGALEDQREAANADEHKWRLGVGIGVGLGVPIFMAAAFGGGFIFGKKRGRRAAASMGETTK